MEPRVLLIDIETAPSLATVWRTGNQYVSHDSILVPGHTLCFGYKWLGAEDVSFSSEWKGGPKRMTQKAHALLTEADVVCHYNGVRFDVPHLNTEFLKYELGPPAPFQQLDLYATMKSRFWFENKKLKYLARVIDGVDEKRQVGYGLWLDVVRGKGEVRDAARARMEEYCCQDVTVLEQLYIKIAPWINRHPNMALFNPDGLDRCTKCTSTKLQRRGYARTAAGSFPRYQCQNCGSWLRGAKRASTTPMREAQL